MVNPSMSTPQHANVDAGSLHIGGQLFRYLAVSRSTPDLPGLTPAEREVVQMVREGLANKEIAARRNTSVNTVGNQLAVVFSKLGVESRFELVEVVSQLSTRVGTQP
jgi:DNA-binding NarL/FixJ family response regulator